MAVSAFKSTSKRANFTTSSSSTNPSPKENDARKKIPPRRSRSVSAFSRNYPDTSIPSPPLPSVDYLNKRDNPLFCNSSPDGFDSEGIAKNSNFDEVSSNFDDKRGRSVSRSTDCMNGNQVGRSLPRRVRSVSRGHYGKSGNSESEAEHEYSLASNLRNKGRDNGLTKGVKRADLMMNGTELSKQITSSNTWSSRHPLLEPSDGASSCARGPSWEDGISTSSYSEVEEKTIRSVFDQMKTFRGDNPGGDVGTGGIYETVRSEVRRAVSEIRNDLENGIRKKSTAIITTANVSDIPPELVNPEAIELVSDIRRVYATKLEQSQERARKLREDLAVEEQRGQELSKILKEILPDPKTAGTQKYRPRRKASNERHKMSQRLAEEAMNYFDECVSISTFDSSDFSAPEDPQLISVAATSALSSSRFPPNGGGSSASTSYVSEGRLCSTMESDTRSQVSFIHGQSDLRASSSSDTSQTYGDGNQDNLGGPNTGRTGTNQLYSTQEPTETDGILDLRNYVKRFEKGFQKHDSEQRKLRSSYRSEEYKFSESAERMLFDKVIFKNRIESGGLLLCGVRIY